MFSETASKLSMLDYMKGRNLLDQSQDITNFKESQNYFINAANSSPNFASAYAGLCEALLNESWIGNEKLLLEKAEVACGKALHIFPEHPYITSVNFFLLRRTGRVKDALALHSSNDQSWSKGVDYIHALSATKFDAYRQHPENDAFLKDAKQLVARAITIDPNYWKSYNTLGLIEFSIGNTQKAIDAMAIAVTYNPNELSYVNLGTLSFCQTNEEEALEYYAKSLELTSDHFLANEMIGLVHYYNKNYQASYEYRKKALKSLGDNGVHNIHGAIAESAEKLGLKEEAKKQFRKAIKIIQRDTLRGNLTPTDEAIGLYYDIKLRLLNGKNINIDNAPLKQKINQLTDLADNLESSAIIRLALSQYYFEQFAQAQKLLKSASERCPAYLKLPDLELLFEQEGTI
jgi:tetratricopeptide (TPR) repeat protein